MLVLCRQCVQYVLEGTVTCPHCGGDARQMSARYRDGDGPASDPHLRLRHKTIKKVTADLEAMKFNTAIAALMEYVNDLSKGGVTRDDAITLAQLTAPFAPHVADEAWEMLGQQGFVIETAWPQYADAFAIESEATLAVQVNGKPRGITHAARNAAEAAIRAQALALPPVAKHVETRTIKSGFIVPYKVVNIVTE